MNKRIKRIVLLCIIAIGAFAIRVVWHSNTLAQQKIKAWDEVLDIKVETVTDENSDLRQDIKRISEKISQVNQQATTVERRVIEGSQSIRDKEKDVTNKLAEIRLALYTHAVSSVHRDLDHYFEITKQLQGDEKAVAMLVNLLPLERRREIGGSQQLREARGHLCTLSEVYGIVEQKIKIWDKVQREWQEDEIEEACEEIQQELSQVDRGVAANEFARTAFSRQLDSAETAAVNKLTEILVARYKTAQAAVRKRIDDEWRIVEQMTKDEAAIMQLTSLLPVTQQQAIKNSDSLKVVKQQMQNLLHLHTLILQKIKAWSKVDELNTGADLAEAVEKIKTELQQINADIEKKAAEDRESESTSHQLEDIQNTAAHKITEILIALYKETIEAAQKGIDYTGELVEQLKRNEAAFMHLAFLLPTAQQQSIENSDSLRRERLHLQKLQQVHMLVQQKINAWKKVLEIKDDSRLRSTYNILAELDRVDKELFTCPESDAACVTTSGELTKAESDAADWLIKIKVNLYERAMDYIQQGIENKEEMEEVLRNKLKVTSGVIMRLPKPLQEEIERTEKLTEAKVRFLILWRIDVWNKICSLIDDEKWSLAEEELNELDWINDEMRDLTDAVKSDILNARELKEKENEVVTILIERKKDIYRYLTILILAADIDKVKKGCDEKKTEEVLLDKVETLLPQTLRDRIENDEELQKVIEDLLEKINVLRQ